MNLFIAVQWHSTSILYLWNAKSLVCSVSHCIKKILLRNYSGLAKKSLLSDRLALCMVSLIVYMALREKTICNFLFSDIKNKCPPPPLHGHMDGYISTARRTYHNGDKVRVECTLGSRGSDEIQCEGGKWTSPSTCIGELLLWRLATELKWFFNPCLNFLESLSFYVCKTVILPLLKSLRGKVLYILQAIHDSQIKKDE